MNVKVKINISVIAVFVASAVLFVVQTRELAAKYEEAVSYAQKGEYETARDLISKIGDYKDSESLEEEYGNEVLYKKALDYYKEKNYDEALGIFETLSAVDGGGFKDSINLQNEVGYEMAIMNAKEGKIDEARIGFKNLPVGYLDTSQRLDQISYLEKFVDHWYCSEHQIDLKIRGYIDEDNTAFVSAEIVDRNGFLLGDETNKLVGENIVLNEDRFLWDLFDNGIKYAVLYEDNKIKVSKQGSDDANIVPFVRKLEKYNPVDGDINAAVNRDVDAGVK